MEALNAATLDYCKTRKQFGVPLGSFQVLQHRMVDMFIALEEATSLTQHLFLGLQDGDTAYPGWPAAPRPRSARRRASLASRPCSCTAAWA